MQKTYSQIRPKDFDIEKEDESGLSTVLFFDNIEEEQTEDGIQYSYNMYKIKVPTRPNLEQTIEQRYDEWLEFAKKQYANQVKEVSLEERISTAEAVIAEILGMEV